jgi:hypothetical protein
LDSIFLPHEEPGYPVKGGRLILQQVGARDFKSTRRR